MPPVEVTLAVTRAAVVRHTGHITQLLLLLGLAGPSDRSIADVEVVGVTIVAGL
jgi:hypothetical protein